MTPAICPDASELEPFVIGELSGDEWQRVDDHLSGCEACRGIVGEITANLHLASALRNAWPQPAAAPRLLNRVWPVAERIGKYQIIREIGRGGMGVVYEAQQQGPTRRVALKLLSVAHIHDSSGRHFRREVQALARLKHDSIATIHDAGHTSDGQPFLVMELAEGEKLGRWMQQSGATMAKKLDLFRTVCEAIAYAHQRGVIHRDLKPSNIIIEHGRPKILDFGLAKLLEAEDDVESVYVTANTEVGRIQGTLPYMSPEQARGDSNDIDVRSDVYSLGVILFEMLTGRLPYDADWSRLPGAVRVICESPPISPSTLQRSIRGDLETIVLKALQKDPAKRYASASALADDIVRWLSNQPITARRPTLLYQARMLLARHTVAVLSAVALFVGAIGVGVWMSILYAQSNQLRLLAVQAHQNAADEALRATSEAERTDRMNHYLRGVIGWFHPAHVQGQNVTLAEVLDSALLRIERELNDDPVLQADLLDTLGGGYLKLMRLDQADRCLQRALDLRRGIASVDDLELADTVRNLAFIRYWQKRFDESDQLYREALMLLDRAEPDAAQLRASVLNHFGRLLLETGSLAEARDIFEQAIPVLRENPQGERDLLSALNEYALALRSLGDSRAAEPIMRESLEMRRRIFGERHYDTAIAMNSLGMLVWDLGDPKGAEELLRTSLAIREELFGPDRRELASPLTNLGTVLADLGVWDESERLLRRALAIRLRELGSHEHSASTMQQLALVLAEKGRFDEALSLAHEARAMCQNLFGEEHIALARALQVGSEVASLAAHDEEALILALDALSVMQRLGQDGHTNMIRVYLRLGCALVAIDRAHEAAEHLSRALALARERLPHTHALIAVCALHLAGVWLQQDRINHAEPLLDEASFILERSTFHWLRERTMLDRHMQYVVASQR